ncbi:zinc-binding dehydrogenase [Isoptericola sp. NPDC055881]
MTACSSTARAGAGGAFLIGLARHRGAEVTAVDRGDRAEHLRRPGADRTIAYVDEDWATHRDRFDGVVDLVASRTPWRVHRALRPRGRYQMLGGRTDLLLGMPTFGTLIGLATGKHVGVLMVPQSATESLVRGD